MRVENNKIIECTENELFSIYLESGYDDIFSFSEYIRRCKEAGTKIIEEN